MSCVEEALRSQASVWREIAERVNGLSNREFPSEAAKRILIFGVGSSHHAAQLIANTLVRDKSRPRMPVFACSSMAIGHDVVPTRGDWVFAISHRGKTASTLAALEACHQANAFTVLVSARGVKQPESAHLILETCDLEQVEPHTISVTSAVCAVSTLFLGTKAREEWEAMGMIPSPNLEVLQRRLGGGPSIIVGEWEGEWLAREGALKLMEMARLPVRAYSTEEFFHGPHFSRGPEDKIWQVMHAKDRRADEVHAAYRFDIHGNTPLAWVPALVEMQWAALAVATNRGQDPDLVQAPAPVQS
ncbi:SIS domain-containing protein [Bdellovibrionota bacterium FG-1]